MIPGSTTTTDLTDNDVSKPRLLVVDDVPEMVSMLEIFCSRLGYDHVSADNGEDALKQLASSPIDLVITDLYMPGISGADLLVKIRSDYPTIPVIVITGQPRVTAAVECMKSGASDFVTKPFDLNELSESIKTVLVETKRLQREAMLGRTKLAMTGLVIGNYRISELLGEGAMGSVFLAHRIDDSSADPLPYALKVVKPRGNLSNRERQSYSERFLLEARAAASIDHRNVVDIIEYDTTPDTHIQYLVMSMLDGKPLRAYLKSASLSVIDKTRILRQVAAAMTAIHEAGVIHRDIKPDNVIIGDDNHVTLVDFSVAKLPNSEIVTSSHIVGSPAYLSPDVFNGDDLDHRADIFSFGVLAYELYLGRRPFPDCDSLARYEHVLNNDRPLRPRVLLPSFPLELEVILGKALKKDREERYQSSGEIVRDFASFLAHLRSPSQTSVLRMAEHHLQVDDWA
jgi:serine/threonine-protein kinase